MRLCSVDSCKSKHYCKSYCRIHYTRFIKHGDPLQVKQVILGCSVEDCKEKHGSYGYCSKHAQRFKKYGDPLKTQKIYGQNREANPLYQPHRDMIARCYNPEHKSYKNYGGRGIKVCERWLDQITGLSSFTEDMGKKPDGKTKNGHSLYSLDRIDVNGNYSCGHCEECTDNNWSANCTWATYSQQNRNQRPRPSTSGYQGVYMAGNRWTAIIKINGKQIYLGTFDGPKEASGVYEKAKAERDKDLKRNKWVSEVPCGKYQY